MVKILNENLFINVILIYYDYLIILAISLITPNINIYSIIILNNIALNTSALIYIINL